MSEGENFKPFVCPVRNGSSVDKSPPPESHLQSHDDVQLLNLDFLHESFKDVRDIHENELTDVGAVFDLENNEPSHSEIESCLSGESPNRYPAQYDPKSRVIDRANGTSTTFEAGCSNMETGDHLTHQAFTQHGDEKLLPCKACGKTFRFKSQLDLHLVAHSNERPHTCDICEKRFKTNWHLNRHKFLHANERPHKCYICNQSYKTKDCLKRHKLIHINKK